MCTKCGRQLELIGKEKIKVENVTKEFQHGKNNKFYTKNWFMWLMMVVYPPIGIFFMWKFHDKMKKNTKIILTIAFSLFFILTVAVNRNKKVTIGSNSKSASNITKRNKANKIRVIDFSGMQENEISDWCKEKNLSCVFKKEYSDNITKGGFIKQSVKATEQIPEGSEIVVIYSLGNEPTEEQKSALKSTEFYIKTMHMSKQKTFDQLVSKYGEKFDSDTAKYAVDNIECDWNQNALETAKYYRSTMNMSKQRIYDQLISKYGDNFTKDEAKYAVNHLDD